MNKRKSRIRLNTAKTEKEYAWPMKEITLEELKQRAIFGQSVKYNGELINLEDFYK